MNSAPSQGVRAARAGSTPLLSAMRASSPASTIWPIKICTGYKHKGELLKGVPASLNVLAEVEPVYETFPGWKTDTSSIRTYDALPAGARKYLERMAEVTGIALGIVSVGPSREQTIVLVKDLF